MKKIVIIIVSVLIAIILIAGICLLNYLNLGEQQLAILNYHHVLPKADIEKYNEDPNYAMTLELFDEEMKYLYDNGYKTLTIDEFVKWKNNEYTLPEKAVMLTVDDGCTSLIEYVNPTLEKYGLNIVSFVITDRVEDVTKEFTPEVRTYMGKDYLESKKLSCVEYGSHSHGMHKRVDGEPRVKTMSREEIYEDLQTSFEIEKGKIYSYPFSTFNKDVVEALKKSDFDYALRGHNKKTYRNEHRYLVSRIGDVETMERFKGILETDNYDQNFIDKLKGLWIKIKF